VEKVFSLFFVEHRAKVWKKKKIQKLQQQKEKGKIRPFKKRCHLLSKNTFEKGIF